MRSFLAFFVAAVVLFSAYIAPGAPKAPEPNVTPTAPAAPNVTQNVTAPPAPAAA